MAFNTTDVPTNRQYTAKSHDFRVTVVPEFLSRESNPYEGVFTFAYTVKIENLGSASARLVSRHWDIYSAGELLSQVDGEGVVGQKPVIEPGDSFQYTSGSIIPEPVGSMAGHYNLVGVDGEEFKIEIPSFDLACETLIQ